jgi:hypothetical protein
MKAERIEEYHKHGCNFSGKLVKVDYSEDMQVDKRWGKFGSEVSIDYAVEAEKLVKERYPDCQILMTMPEVVARIA